MRTSWWAAIVAAVLTWSGAHDGRAQHIDSAPAAVALDRLPDARTEARAEDATGSVRIEPSQRNDRPRNLSYLAYYAYSEVPPETKPADIVLESLKSIPPGTAVDEIKRVSSVLGL